MKRITVVFRGTVGGGDIWADARFIHTGKYFKDLNKRVKVHKGFSGKLSNNILVISYENMWKTSPNLSSSFVHR